MSIPIAITFAVLCILFLFAGCATNRASFRDEADPVKAAGDWYCRTMGDDACAVIATGAGNAYGDTHALFRIASITKLYMMLLAYRLVEEGKIDLDERLGSFGLDGLPDAYGDLTLDELLNHRTGLPRELMSLTRLRDGLKCLSCGLFDTHLYAGFEQPRDLMRELRKKRWTRLVRKGKPSYSNIGFGLAWLAIEKRIGKSIEDMLADEILEPNGFRETSFKPIAGMNVMPLTSGDVPWFRKRGTPVREHPLGPVFVPSGGLYSSASDCERMSRLYWNVIDRAIARCGGDSLRDGDIVAGLGVRHLSNGTPVLFRSGMLYGGASFIGFDLRSRRVAIILRNSTSWPDDVGFELMERLFVRKTLPNGDVDVM